MTSTVILGGTSMIQLNGFNIVISPYFTTGYKQCRTHRKKRINKKWAKKYGDKPVYDTQHAYLIDNQFYMSPAFYNKLKEVCDASE